MVVPFGLVVSIFARRSMNPVLLAAATALSATALALFALSRRSFGKCEVRTLGDRVVVGAGAAEILGKEVHAWTLAEGVARLYSSAAGWRLAFSAKESETFRSALASIFGNPLDLHRRGSLRARRIAGLFALLGVGLSGVGIGLDVPPLVALGVPATVFGLAALGALSQKVAAGGRFTGRARRRR